MLTGRRFELHRLTLELQLQRLELRIPHSELTLRWLGSCTYTCDLAVSGRPREVLGLASASLQVLIAGVKSAGETLTLPIALTLRDIWSGNTTRDLHNYMKSEEFRKST